METTNSFYEEVELSLAKDELSLAKARLAAANNWNAKTLAQKRIKQRTKKRAIRTINRVTMRVNAPAPKLSLLSERMCDLMDRMFMVYRQEELRTHVNDDELRAHVNDDELRAHVNDDEDETPYWMELI